MGSEERELWEQRALGAGLSEDEIRQWLAPRPPRSAVRRHRLRIRFPRPSRRWAVFLVAAAVVIGGLAVALLLLTACQSYPVAKTPSPQSIPSTSFHKAIPFQLITQQAPLGDRPAQPFFGLVWQPGDLESLAGKLPGPALEFARGAIRPGELILILFAGVKGSSGYQIAIQNVWQEGNQIIILVEQTQPDTGQVVEPARTLPFYLANLARNDLPQESTLVFVFKDDRGNILAGQTVINPK